MSTILDDRPLITIGSTMPRLFTPPLERNLNTPGAQEFCPCGCGLNEKTSWGFDCIYFLTKVVGWQLLAWQVWLYIHTLEKGAGGEGFRFKILLILIARQNGKTKYLKGIGLWRLFVSRFGRADKDCPGARLALIACQSLDYAEATLKEVVDDIRDSPMLARELLNHRLVNGNNRAILTNKRYWRAATATRKGGRSLSVDIAMLDEMREHTTWDAWNAIVPTTTARKYSQVVCTTNAGDQRSEVLRALRDGAVRRVLAHDTDDTQTGFFEWSVSSEEDPRDEHNWYQANPAMGVLPGFTIDDLRGFYEAMETRNMPGFQTEHLCQWVDAMTPGIIPAANWADTIDSTSARAPGSPAYACLDVNYERSRSYIAIAALRADRKYHVEVIHADRGTEWIIPWLREREEKFAGLTVQQTGAPASGLIDDLEAAGIRVVPWGPGLEVASGCARIYDFLAQRKVFHRPASALDRAAGAGVARNVGDAWVFDRRASPVDVSPIFACAGALWLATEHPMGAPRVHQWPDDDVIEQWQQQGEQLWKQLDSQP